MQITSVGQSPIAPLSTRLTTASKLPQASMAKRPDLSTATQLRSAAASAQLTASNVSAAAIKAADSDGDGRTGVAALNDGDAASRAAHAGRLSRSRFDVRRSR